MMALLVGALLAFGAGVFARWLGLDRDRAFYSVVMIVIACLYSLFAVMGGSTRVLILETAIGAVFIIAAAMGFKSSLWIVAAALFAHGVYDFTHAMFFTNPGAPPFWPAFCGAYDVVAAGYLGWLLTTNRVPAAIVTRTVTS
jgi:hypothetical protein